MASLLVLAGAMIHDRYRERKDSKRRKAMEDERKHAQLEAQAERRAKRQAVERNYESEDEQEDEPLPRYEDVIKNDMEGGAGSSNHDDLGGEGTSRRLVEPRNHPGMDRAAEIL